MENKGHKSQDERNDGWYPSTVGYNYQNSSHKGGKNYKIKVSIRAI